jgi:hypothetical protein
LRRDHPAGQPDVKTKEDEKEARLVLEGINLADVTLDKTKDSVKAYKRGYLKGFQDGLAAGRKTD